MSSEWAREKAREAVKVIRGRYCACNNPEHAEDDVTLLAAALEETDRRARREQRERDADYLEAKLVDCVPGECRRCDRVRTVVAAIRAEE